MSLSEGDRKITATPDMLRAYRAKGEGNQMGRIKVSQPSARERDGGSARCLRRTDPMGEN